VCKWRKIRITRCEKSRFYPVWAKIRINRNPFNRALLYAFPSISDVFLVWTPYEKNRVASLAFFQLKLFLFLIKGRLEFGFFWPIRFFMSIWQIKDDFSRYLGTGKFLETVSGHTMINFYWKLCTRIHNFLFCCFMLLGLQFQVTLQQDQSFENLINGVSFILFMYKIFIYCLSKARLGVLKVSSCIYLVFGLFCYYLALFRIDLVCLLMTT